MSGHDVIWEGLVKRFPSREQAEQFQRTLRRQSVIRECDPPIVVSHPWEKRNLGNVLTRKPR